MAVPARVVIVEDEADVLALVRARLGLDERFTVAGTAADATEALATVAAERPHIVVLDLRVPGAIGSDLIPLILEANPATKVAVFTSAPPELMRDEALSRGAARYVVKGDVELLVDALADLVAGLDEASGEFSGDLSSVRRARRSAADTLRSWHLDHLVDPVMLIVSELATNAVVHARSPFTLRLALGANAVRVEVSDCGPGLPNPVEPDPTGIGGRGLVLVAHLSVAWGVDAEVAPCKTIWCEVARDDALVR